MKSRGIDRKGDSGLKLICQPGWKHSRILIIDPLRPVPTGWLSGLILMLGTPLQKRDILNYEEGLMTNSLGEEGE